MPYVYFDPELRLIHTDRNCRAAEMAVKYQYLESVFYGSPHVGGRPTAVPAEIYLRGRPCPSCELRDAQAGQRPSGRRGSDDGPQGALV